MKHNIMVIVIMVLLCCPPDLSANQNIMIVGHKDVTDSITKREIKEIFLGHKTRWANNASLTFVLLGEKQTYETFLREYVGKSASQYRRYWKMKVFNGTGRMPRFFKNEADVVTFVAENQGAIAFIRSDNINTENVKIIKVNP